MKVSDVRFVKEFYPRLREDNATIERYRAAIDKLPPIVVARDGILVDGFHRWQAFKQEGLDEIPAENIGNLSDLEIIKESIKRNATHGHQLVAKDKRRMADQLYRQGTRDELELCDLLSVTAGTLKKYLEDARRDEKEARQAKAWDLWLECYSEREIEEKTGVSAKTVHDWLARKKNEFVNQAPASRQHFDIWVFHTASGDSCYFGKMAPQIVENLLWFYTEPGDIVVDPFVGGGTTIDVCKVMGRRIWASDLHPSTPTLNIRQHDMTNGWPAEAPQKADLVILDPPYWIQAKGKYSDSDADFGNMDLHSFYQAWERVVKACVSKAKRLAFIISPTQTDDGVVDHATDMLEICKLAGYSLDRRIIVPYNTQQVTGRQVTWARENKRMLKLYRDLVVMR